MITSSSHQDFTITSPDGTIQNRTSRWSQQIVFQSCPLDELVQVAPPTQQLSVDQIFVMFDPENELIRYAMTTKMGSTHGELRGHLSGGVFCHTSGRSEGHKQKPEPGSVSPAAVREEEEVRGRGVGPETSVLAQWGEGASGLRSEVTSQVDSTNKLAGRSSCMMGKRHEPSLLKHQSS